MAREKKQFDFIKNRKTFIIIAACFLAVGIIFNVIFGTELDINFKGGTIFTYSYSGDIEQDALTGIAKDILGNDAEVSFSKDLGGNLNQVTMTLTEIPDSVLTYTYTVPSDNSVQLNADDIAAEALAALGKESTVNTEENGTLVITPNSGGKIVGDKVEALTEALTAKYSGAQFTLVSTNDVNDIANKLKSRIVSDFGTKLVYTYTVDSVDTSALTTDIQAVTGFGVQVTSDDSAKTVTVVPTDSAEKDGAFTDQIQQDLKSVLDKYGLTLSESRYNSIELITSNSVKPTVGRGFFIKCLVAMIIGGLIITIYIALRFRKIGGLSAAMFATFALIHDILISYFVYVVFRIPLDDNFIAVVLTILGYSINGTIVVYDRIRANERKFGNTKSISEIVNTSVNGVLTRNIYTTLSTLIAVLAICIIAKIRNLDSIISFAFPMAIGIIAGFYSSLLLSSPIWAWWRERKLAKAKNLKD